MIEMIYILKRRESDIYAIRRADRRAREKRKGVYEYAVGFRHLTTYNHAVATQPVLWLLSLLTGQVNRARGRIGSKDTSAAWTTLLNVEMETKTRVKIATMEGRVSCIGFRIDRWCPILAQLMPFHCESP